MRILDPYSMEVKLINPTFWKHLFGSNLIITETIKLPIPINRQVKCCLTVKGAQCTNYPPNYIIKNCTVRVIVYMMKNMRLLKNPLNTLISDPLSFLQLIWLNACKRTNVWKKMVKCLACSGFHFSIANEFWRWNKVGPRYRIIESIEI